MENKSPIPTALRENSESGGPPPSNGAAVLRLARRWIVFVLGMSVVLVGIVMVVTPGPAVVVIPLGLAILATEFVWARKILDRLKARLRRQSSQSPATARSERNTPAA